MTTQELKDLGFKKKKQDIYYWYRLIVRDTKGKKHEFITNDNSFFRNTNKWVIGWNYNNDPDIFWFNNRLESLTQFRVIFEMLTSKSI